MLSQYLTMGFFGWVGLLCAVIIYKRGPGPLFFLATFPGTLLHEFAHYLVAHLMGGRPEPMDLVPRKENNRWTLGSVSFYPNWKNGAFVALAPLSLFPLGVVFWQLGLSEELGWQFSYAYLAGCCLISALPSREDWMIAVEYPVGLLAIAFVVLGAISSYHYLA